MLVSRNTCRHYVFTRPIRWSACTSVIVSAANHIRRIAFQFMLIRSYNAIATAPPIATVFNTSLCWLKWVRMTSCYTGVGPSADRWIVRSLSTHARLSSIDHTWSQIDHSRLLARPVGVCCPIVSFAPKQFSISARISATGLVRVCEMCVMSLSFGVDTAHVKRLINLSAKDLIESIPLTVSLTYRIWEIECSNSFGRIKD